MNAREFAPRIHHPRGSNQFDLIPSVDAAQYNSYFLPPSEWLLIRMMMENKQARFTKSWSGGRLIIGLVATLLFFVVSGVVSYLNTRTLTNNALLVTHTYEVLTALSDILSIAKDAETGRRGYLITGDTSYLEPYSTAVNQIEERLNDLEILIRDNPAQQSRLVTLRSRVKVKLDELARALALHE